MAARLEIRTRARIRADQTNSTKPDDVSYNYWIDEACKEVWGDLLQAGWPVDYSSTTITATGAATYAIGAGTNIFSVNGVFYFNGGQTYELKRVNQANVAALRAQAAMSNLASYYEVRVSPTAGLVVELYPRVTSGTYTVQFTADHPGLASDVAIWYGPNRSDELVTLRVAAKGLHNEGMDRDAHFLEKEYDALLAKLQNQASWIDARNPATVRDVTHAVQYAGIHGFDYPVGGGSW